MRKRLVVTQQARPEDEAAVKAAYEKLGIAAEVSPFFDNMAERIAASHFVISRAGASTVSEIAVIGRPRLLVPYPFALDHDQAANAAALEADGGTIVRQQKDLSPQKYWRRLSRTWLAIRPSPPPWRRRRKPPENRMRRRCLRT